MVGVYENKWGNKIYDLPSVIKIWDTIVITSQAFNLCCEGKCEEKVYFKDIIRLEEPKNTTDDLVMHVILKDKVVDLAILRTNEPTNNVKDVFSWWNFLRSFPRTSFGSKTQRLENAERKFSMGKKLIGKIFFSKK